MSELLDIVNEKDEVIGTIERDDNNRGSYLYRMIFIAFYTADKQIIFQRRSMAKKLNPGKLTTTVSGHVASGSTYDETAIKEGYEESGVEIDPSKLHQVGVFAGDAMRAVYVYAFDGTVADLKVEAGEGDGFVTMSIAEFREAFSENPDMFTPFFQTEGAEAFIAHIEQNA